MSESECSDLLGRLKEVYRQEDYLRDARQDIEAYRTKLQSEGKNLLPEKIVRQSFELHQREKIDFDEVAKRLGVDFDVLFMSQGDFVVRLHEKLENRRKTV